MSHHHAANSRHRAEQRLANRSREIDAKLAEARKLVDDAKEVKQDTLELQRAISEGM